MLWKKAGLVCIVLAALAIVAYAQTSSRAHARSTNLQVAMAPGYLGVGVRDLSAERAKALGLKDDSGVEVTEVTPGQAGANVGMHVSDVVLEINGQKVDTSERFTESIMGMAPGSKVNLMVMRNGMKHTLVATLGSRPAGLPISNAPQGVMIPGVPMTPLSPEEIQAMIAGDAPKVGFEGEPLTPQLADFFGVREGVLVRTVTARTPAEKAGLKAGDVVIKVNGVPVSSPREISGIVRQAKKTVVFTVVRNKKEMTLNVEMASIARAHPA